MLSQGENDPKNKCDLNGQFSYIIQIALFTLIFVAVKIKHHFETPRRKLPLFFLDGFKQLSSNGLIHVINIWYSISRGNSLEYDQCGIYFVSILIDMTLGTLVCFLLLRSFNRLVSYKTTKRLQSGNYFKRVPSSSSGHMKYEIDLCCWFQQTAVWCFIVLLMKLLVAGLHFTCTRLLYGFGDLSMKLFGTHENLKVTMVVFVIPVVLNVMQFLVQDTFIKKNDFEITDIDIMRDYYDCLGDRLSRMSGLAESMKEQSSDSYVEDATIERLG